MARERAPKSIRAEQPGHRTIRLKNPPEPFSMLVAPPALLVCRGWGILKSIWSYLYGSTNFSAQPSTQPDYSFAFDSTLRHALEMCLGRDWMDGVPVQQVLRWIVLRRSRENWEQLWDLSARYVPALGSSCICRPQKYSGCMGVLFQASFGSGGNRLRHELG